MALKAHLRLLIGGYLLINFLFVALVLWADPLQIFHDQPLEPPLYVDCMNGCWEVPGTIKRYFFHLKDKEAVIIGPCLTMDMTSREAAQLGGIEKALNLGFLFPNPQSGSMVLSFLKNSPNLKRVVMMIPEEFSYALDGYQEDLSRFPQFLYDDSPKFCHLKQIFSASLPYIGEFLLAYFMDTPSVERRKARTYWFDEPCAARAFTREKDFLEEFRSTCARKRETILEVKGFLDVHNLEAVEKRFNTIERSFSYLMEVVSSMPHVQFDFLIPPYCSVVWASDGEIMASQEHLSRFQDYIGGLLYILDRIEAFPNIHLYAFDDVAEITGNTANYYDYIHYGLGVNRYILRSIKAGKHRITKVNVLEYLRRMAKVILNFDPTPDYEHTVTFEGPLAEETEKAFSRFPPPTGPSPLLP